MLLKQNYVRTDLFKKCFLHFPVQQQRKSLESGFPSGLNKFLDKKCRLCPFSNEKTVNKSIFRYLNHSAFNVKRVL